MIHLAARWVPPFPETSPKLASVLAQKTLPIHSKVRPSKRRIPGYQTCTVIRVWQIIVHKFPIELLAISRLLVPFWCSSACWMLQKSYADCWMAQKSYADFLGSQNLNLVSKTMTLLSSSPNKYNLPSSLWAMVLGFGQGSEVLTIDLMVDFEDGTLVCYVLQGRIQLYLCLT